PFIQVTDLRLNAERTEQSPAANPQKHFLLESQFRPAPVQLARNPPMRGKVRSVVAIQQIKRTRPVNTDAADRLELGRRLAF
ncbi:MAG: hypothetical protein ABSC15_26990, partial [Terriglobales bacterium]